MGLWRGGLFLLVLLGTVVDGQAGTVLTIITPGPQSHLFGMKKITLEMAARGHKVAFLAAEKDAERLRPTDVHIISYAVFPWKGETRTGSIQLAGPHSLIATIAKYQPTIGNSCESLLANASVMAQIQDFGAELLLATVVFPCVGILASRLDLPFVNYLPATPIEPFFTSLWRGSNRRLFTANPLSYVPQMEMDFTSQYLSFAQRLRNFVKYWHTHLADYLYVRPGVLKIYQKYGVDLDEPRERRRLVLTLCNADFAIEWLRSMPPNFKMIGPVLPEPASPLPPNIEEYMVGSGEQGVLYVAMGTVATLGLEERRAMAAAFAKLPVRVLWRLSKSELPDDNAITDLHLSDNTKVVTWLPQNDVLGHPRTRAFLSHCGANSLYEAAYHGVPVAALPFFGDQPGNAGQAVARGFAVRVRHSDIGTEAFPAALTELLGNGSYAAAAKAISVKLRARKRTPVQEAVDWVEHVLATRGEAYLRTPDDDLPLLVRLSVDVWAACLGAAAILSYMTVTAVCAAAHKLGRAHVNGARKKVS